MGNTLQANESSCGGRLVATTGVALPLKSADVRGAAEGGLARVILRQVFANPHAEPLQVTYSMPLPADGAVAGYEFCIGERRVVGEIDRRAAARERFEMAILQGRTAGLLDQERASLFTQELGNVPPGTEVAVTLTIDQPLAWVSEETGGAAGEWEWRFPTVVPPRYLGAPGRVPDAQAITQDVADGPTGAHVAIDFVIRDRIPEGRGPESPSHRLTIGRAAAGKEVPTSPDRPPAAPGTLMPAVRTTLAGETAALDRDIVVRWPVTRPAEGATIRVARPEAGHPHAGHAFGVLTIVPPDPAETGAHHPRDLILLIDTSGSMHGEPLAQARKVALALVDSLTEEDRLEMTAFASAPMRWPSGPAAANAASRADARRWLNALKAGGGTEMREGVREAICPLRPDHPRQVILMTDGQIGFEREIVRELRDSLPAGSRLHAVGIGSAVNRGLTRPAARAGRGVEIIIGTREDAERGAARLVAATRRPVVVDLTIEGDALVDCAPRRLPDLMAGAPVLIAARLRPKGGGLVVRGRAPSGHWEARVAVPPTPQGSGDPAVPLLYARERVEDLEIDLAAGAPEAEIDPAIETIGLEFAIATRLTSWVAVSEEPSVDPRQPARRVRMPQELPFAMSAEGMGLRLQMAAFAAPVHSLWTAFDLLENPEDDSALCMPAPREERELPSAPKPMSGMPKAAPGPAPRSGTFFGRWLGPARDGIRVLEFEVVGGPIDWHPSAVATAELIDGTRVVMPVEIQASTIVGPIQPGRLVRLGLRIDQESSTATAVVLVESAGRPIRIEI
jgi:Ca-activated chloride channel family protein